MNKWVHLYIIKTIEKVIEKFDYSMVPAGFAHCFSGDCLKAGQCLRHQITRFIPDDRWSVSTMNPAQIRPGGNCPGFMTDRPLKYAYGMTHLLDNLLYVQAKAIKHQLLMYYGKAYFYRLKRKERCFLPEDQQYIRNLFLQYGAKEEPVFDYYQDNYEWDRHKAGNTHTTSPAI